MPDRLENLRATLNQLEVELRELEAIDDETRRELAEVALEIAAVLARGKATGEPRPAEGTLRQRLEDFEASHPQLALIVGRIIDGLGQLGI